jgi:hypothetical protein
MEAEAPRWKIGHAQRPSEPAPPELKHAELPMVARINLGTALITQNLFAEFIDLLKVN